MSCKSNDNSLLSLDAEAGRATGPAAAQVLSTIAQTLDEAPPGRRYDVTVIVSEVETRERHNSGDYR